MGFCQRRRQQFPSSHLLDVLVFLTKKGFMVWCLPVITKRFWLCPLFCCGLLAEVGDGCTEGMGSLYSTRNPSLSLTWLNCRLKGTYYGAKPGFNSCHPSPGFHSLSWAASHPPKVPFFLKKRLFLTWINAWILHKTPSLSHGNDSKWYHAASWGKSISPFGCGRGEEREVTSALSTRSWGNVLAAGRSPSPLLVRSKGDEG